MTRKKAAAPQETLFVEPTSMTDEKFSEMKIVEEAPAATKKKAVSKVSPKAHPQTLPAKAEPQNLLATLYVAISDPNCEPAKLHALLDARDRLMKEQARVEFFTAYIDLQSELPSIKRDGKLDQGTTKSGREGVKGRYATFENINAVTRPILAKHRFGLLLLPDVPAEGAGIIIRGQLGYVCETQYGKFVHVENCTIPVPPEISGGKNAAQGVGSSLSYGKRYGAIALLNLVSHAPEDADTDATGGKGKAKASAPAKDEGPKVDTEQVKQLCAAMDVANVSGEAFCRRYGLKSVADLPAASVSIALADLQDHATKAGDARG